MDIGCILQQDKEKNYFMNEIDINKIKEYLSSSDPETISLGFEFLISDYSDLYNVIRAFYPNKKYFDTIVYNLIKGNVVKGYKYFIDTSIIFYIDSYIYEKAQESNNYFTKE